MKSSGFDKGGVQQSDVGRGGQLKVSGGEAEFKRFFPRDNSSFPTANARGGKMGGSLTNLSHSLPGTSANQKGPR